MSEGKKIFFPGCALQQLAPALSQAVYTWLLEKGYISEQVLRCCGLPLKYEGKEEAFSQHTTDLFSTFSEQGISQVVVACPSCYRLLSTISVDQEHAPTILHLAQIMVEEGVKIDPSRVPEGAVFAIHDSCPDRKYQIAANAVRELTSNLNVVEMEHNRKRTMCCGIGEPFFGAEPEVQLRQINRRSQEALDAGATHILNACVNCMLAFTTGDKHVESMHYLELVFGVPIPHDVVQDTHGGLG